MSTLKEDGIKQAVKERYGGQSPKRLCVLQRWERSVIPPILYSASELKAVPMEAVAASAGCGNPVALAELQPGERVLDLGSGGGIDCFLAAHKVGPEGRAFGVDMTVDMVSLARSNAAKVGVSNVEFFLGEIERLPLADDLLDVVISNCVICLSPDKDLVFQEAFRVLKPGGQALRVRHGLGRGVAGGSADGPGHVGVMRGRSGTEVRLPGPDGYGRL